MAGINLSDIEKLAALLKPTNEDFETDEQKVYSKGKKCESSKPQISESETVKKENDINNVLEETNLDVINGDWKKRPEFTISYKQNVNPEDIFLQMGGKSPSIYDCDDIIVSIFLPREKKSTIEITTTPLKLSLTSVLYSLEINLPRTVNPQVGHALWDAGEEKLVVTLRIDNEINNHFT